MVRLSRDELAAEARQYYRNQNWTAPNRFAAKEESFVSKLSVRPDLIAQRDGMLHLVYAAGRISQAAFNLYKLVLFDIEQLREFCHVVVGCEERVSQADERRLKEMGLGILLVRQDADTYMLAQPSLRCFRAPANYKRLPTRVRTGVKKAIQKIETDDVAVGVLDLSQVLETELDRVVPQTFHRLALGRKIQEAQNQGALTPIMVAAANRVNTPRIKRAHPGSHSQRRRDIVEGVQEIVDDCLAILFVL